MKLFAFLKDWGAQSFIATDQWINAVLLPPFSGAIGYADETLSARCWRMHQQGKPWGRLMAFINLLFAWQRPDPAIKDAAGHVVLGHCERAYYKEKLRRNLPPEYRETPGAQTPDIAQQEANS